MDVFLAPDDRRSMAVQIYDQLRDTITSRGLLPGARLTPSRVLATELGISRATVADAYGRLVAEGYAHGRRGGGTIVAETPVSPSMVEVSEAVLRPTSDAGAVERYGTALTTGARYDLSAGRVDATLFPLQAWRRCMRASLSDRDALSTYGEPRRQRSAAAGPRPLDHPVTWCRRAAGPGRRHPRSHPSHRPARPDTAPAR